MQGRKCHECLSFAKIFDNPIEVCGLLECSKYENSPACKNFIPEDENIVDLNKSSEVEEEIVKKIFDIDLVAKHNRMVKSPFKTKKIRFDTKDKDIDKAERLKNRRKNRRNKANRLNDED